MTCSINVYKDGRKFFNFDHFSRSPIWKFWLEIIKKFLLQKKIQSHKPQRFHIITWHINIRKERENWKFKTTLNPLSPNGSIRFNVEIIQARMRFVPDLIMMIKLIKEREGVLFAFFRSAFLFHVHFFLSLSFFPFSPLATSTTVIPCSRNEIFRQMLIVVGGAELILDICREKFRAPFFPRRLLLAPVRGPISRELLWERGNSPSTVSRIHGETCANRREEVVEKRSGEASVAIRNSLVIVAKIMTRKLVAA